MPIYDNQMSEPDMKKIVSSGTKCACGGNLTIAWGGSTGYQGYILRCGNDINHDKLNRHDKKQEALIKQIKEARHMDTVALQNMSETQMMVRINQARFPKDLTAQDKKLLATAAITYGFDPLMGEISIYEGRPYISIDGRYRKAQETNKLDGVESRPATKDERDAWSIPLDDYFFRAEVFVKGASRPFVGWGRVRATESAPGSRTDKTSTYKPIQNNPQRMAEKRAEAQALRKSFHIPLPSIEDIGYENGDAPVRVIEETTGEIIEGEVIDQKQPAPGTEQGEKQPTGQFKDIGALLSFCAKLTPKIDRALFMELCSVDDKGLSTLDVDKAADTIQGYLNSQRKMM